MQAQGLRNGDELHPAYTPRGVWHTTLKVHLYLNRKHAGTCARRVLSPANCWTVTSMETVAPNAIKLWTSRLRGYRKHKMLNCCRRTARRSMNEVSSLRRFNNFPVTVELGAPLDFSQPAHPNATPLNLLNPLSARWVRCRWVGMSARRLDLLPLRQATRESLS